MQIMIVFQGIIPTEKYPVTGNGLRAWTIGRALEEKGHKIYYSTREVPMVGIDALPEEMSEYTFSSRSSLHALVKSIGPDVIIASHADDLNDLGNIEIPIVADLFAPRLLELQFEQARRDREVLNYLQSLTNADFYICTNHRQKYFTLSWLIMSGVDCHEIPVAVIPISTSPVLPKPKKPKELTIVSGGIFWPWQDSIWSLKLLVETMEKAKKGKLLLFGGEYPIERPTIGRFDPLKSLPKSKRIDFRGMLPYPELLGAYCGASLAFDLVRRNSERELSGSFRIIDYLACGLPVVTNNFTDIAEAITEYKAGWILEDEEPEAVHRLLKDILSRPAEIARAGRNAQRLVREMYTWDRSIVPLEAFCKAPRRREKRKNFLSALIFKLWSDEESLKSRKEEIAGLQKTNDHIKEE